MLKGPGRWPGPEFAAPLELKAKRLREVIDYNPRTGEQEKALSPIRAPTRFLGHLLSALRHAAEQLVAAGPLTASPLAAAPADRVERPGEAGTIIFNSASFSRRRTRPSRTIRSIRATALLRPTRLRIALTWATRLLWLHAATASAAPRYAFGMRSACKSIARRQALP